MFQAFEGDNQNGVIVRAKGARPHARAPESAEKIAKITKHPGLKKKIAERQYRSRRRDAEAPRGAQAKRGASPFSVERS